MNAWKPVLYLARSSLWALALVVLLCAVAVVGLDQLASNLKATLTQLQANTQEQQTQLAAKQDDLHNMRDHIQRFEALRAQGLLGTPDRAQWVEQLQTTYQDMGLGGRVSYQLQAPKPLGQDTASAEAAAAAPTDPAQPLAHDLKFELRDVHEADVLNLIQTYRNQVKGRFRVNLCALQDPKETGLTAQCVLRFVTMPIAPPTPPAPAEGTTPPAPAG